MKKRNLIQNIMISLFLQSNYLWRDIITLTCPTGKFVSTIKFEGCPIPPETGPCQLFLERRQCESAGPLQCEQAAVPEFCRVCVPSCYKCVRRKEDCTACRPYGSLFLLSKRCVSNCPERTFKNEGPNPTCSPCRHKSFDCIGGEENDCLSCLKGFSLNFDGTCKRNCQEGRFSKEDTSWKCQDCHNTCKTCSMGNRYSCLTCPEHLKLLDPTSQCESECKEDQFEAVPRICYRCHKDCAICKGLMKTHCIRCKKGKVISARTSICVEECEEGTYRKNSTHCDFCFFGCARCTGPRREDCYECDHRLRMFSDSIFEENFKLKIPYEEIKKKILNLEKYLNLKNRYKGCYLQCFEGFYFNEAQKECQRCHPKCRSCEGPGENNCLSCNRGMIRNVRTCNCIKGYFKLDEKTNYKTGFCHDCYHTCLLCKDEGEFSCFKCRIPFLLANGNSCVAICEEKYFVDLVDKQRVCTPCHSSCGSCVESIEKNRCSKCPGPHIKLDYSKGALGKYGECFDCFNRFGDKRAEFLCPELRMVTITYKNSTKLNDQEYSYHIKQYRNRLAMCLNFSRDGPIVSGSFLPSSPHIILNKVGNQSLLTFPNESTPFQTKMIKQEDEVLIKQYGDAADRISVIFQLVTQILGVGFGLSLIFGDSEALLKIFSLFKILNRFRLVNVSSGNIMNLFLKKLGDIFSQRTKLLYSDTDERYGIFTRGKLSEYRLPLFSYSTLYDKFTFFFVAKFLDIYEFCLRRKVKKGNELKIWDFYFIKILNDLSSVLFLSGVFDMVLYSGHEMLHHDIHIEQTSTTSWSYFHSCAIILIYTFEFIRVYSSLESFDIKKSLEFEKKFLLIKSSVKFLKEDVKFYRKNIEKIQALDEIDGEKIDVDAMEKKIKPILEFKKKNLKHWVYINRKSNQTLLSGIETKFFLILPSSKYYKFIKIVKICLIDVFIISLQLFPKFQITMISLTQLIFFVYSCYFVWKKNIFKSFFYSVSEILTELSILIFLSLLQILELTKRENMSYLAWVNLQQYCIFLIIFVSFFNVFVSGLLTFISFASKIGEFLYFESCFGLNWIEYRMSKIEEELKLIQDKEEEKLKIEKEGKNENIEDSIQVEEENGGVTRRSGNRVRSVEREVERKEDEWKIDRLEKDEWLIGEQQGDRGRSPKVVGGKLDKLEKDKLRSHTERIRELEKEDRRNKETISRLARYIHDYEDSGDDGGLDMVDKSSRRNILDFEAENGSDSLRAWKDWKERLNK